MGYKIFHKTVLAARDAGQPGDTSPVCYPNQAVCTCVSFVYKIPVRILRGLLTSGEPLCRTPVALRQITCVSLIVYPWPLMVGLNSI